MWSKKGIIIFNVGGSVFSYKIFATSKSCVILHNYPNNHKIWFSSSHPERCIATCAYNSQHEPWCTFSGGISKMFQKIVELGTHIHVHIQRKATKWPLTFYDYKNCILPTIYISDHIACDFLSFSSWCIVDYQCGRIIKTDVKLSLKRQK